MNVALQYHTYRRELTQRASDGKGTKRYSLRTVIVKKPHFISQISHKLVFAEYIIAKEKRRITQIFFLSVEKFRLSILHIPAVAIC